MNAHATFPRFLGALAVVAAALTASAEASVPAGRYAVAGGTVTDTKTKLVWQQTVPSDLYTWENAIVYCQTVGASLGGIGWRLPTIKELLTIVDESRVLPSIDPTAFPMTPTPNFWSSSPLAGFPNAAPKAWYITFDEGSSYFEDVNYTEYVRCVR
jgi:hypothetical protein